MRRIMLLVTVVALMMVMLAMGPSAANAAEQTYTCTATSSDFVSVSFGLSKEQAHQFKAAFQGPDTKVRCVKE
jgi:hypothetical protein